MLIPVKDHKGMYRDPASGAIINCDMDGYRVAVNAKKKRKEMNERVELLEKNVKDIKNTLEEIKELLRK